MVTHTPDPPAPSSHLFVHNLMSPNVFSEVQKPSVFTVVAALHTYRPSLIVLVRGMCKSPKTQTRIWFCIRANRNKNLSLAQLTMTLETSIVSAFWVLFPLIRNLLFITKKHKKAPESPTNGENSTSSCNLMRNAGTRSVSDIYNLCRCFLHLRLPKCCQAHNFQSPK